MKRLIYILSIAAIAFACAEEEDKGQPATPEELESEVLITAVGIPTDLPTVKIIGPAGGSIKSDDGVLEINIPAGALSVDTNIIIQPVTNELSEDEGNSYDLLPDGTTFNKPVTLKFHYTDKEVHAGDAPFLGIVYQDKDNAWISDLENQKLDTIAKTVSLDVSHFTIYRRHVFGVKILGKTIMAPGQTAKFTVAGELHPGPDGRVRMGRIPSNTISKWSVNGIIGGNPLFGTIAKGPAVIEYTAPANVTERKFVDLSAHVEIYITGYIMGIPVPQLARDPRLEVSIIPPQKYHVTITVIDSAVSPFYGNAKVKARLPIYTDKATFDLVLDVVLQKAEISHIKNFSPSVLPATLQLGGTLYKWPSDTLGVLDISKVYMNQMVEGSPTIYFTVFHKNATYPGFETKSPDDGEIFTYIPPRPFYGEAGLPAGFQMDVNKLGSYYDSSQPNIQHSGQAITTYFEKFE